VWCRGSPGDSKLSWKSGPVFSWLCFHLVG
jgi:hypothetical protein